MHSVFTVGQWSGSLLQGFKACLPVSLALLESDSLIGKQSARGAQREVGSPSTDDALTQTWQTSFKKTSTWIVLVTGSLTRPSLSPSLATLLFGCYAVEFFARLQAFQNPPRKAKA